MKKWLFILLSVLVFSVTIVSDASARRFGGGSFGRQSARIVRSPAQKQAIPPSREAQKQRNTSTQTAPRRGFGMLGGLLMGLGLGALLSWMGVGAGMANMISMLLVLAIIFGAVALIRRWLARGRRPAYAGGVPDARDTASAMYAGGVPVTPEIGSGLTRAPASGMGQSTADSAFADTDDGVPWSVPEGFDVASLLRAAKENYVRIQSAWDSGKVDAIRDLLTPQIFSEMSMQLYGRGSAENVTEVLSLDARLLGVETIGADYFASVKLSGSVRESKEASAEPFCEVWNLERSVSGVGEWKLAGVQQLS